MPVNFKQKKNTGKAGLAEVRVLQNKLRIVYRDGDTYEVEKNGWEYPTGKYNITLDTAGSKVVFVNPPGGITALVRFVGFSHAKDELPAPKIKRGGPRSGIRKDTGKPYSFYQEDELVATAKLEILQGAYEGLEIAFQFHYAFQPQPGTVNTDIVTTPKQLQKIESFFKAAGFNLASEDIPFSDNVLPWLQDRLIKAKKVFQVELNSEGFVDHFTPLEEYLLPPELRSNGKAKKPAAKKPAARKPKK